MKIIIPNPEVIWNADCTSSFDRVGGPETAQFMFYKYTYHKLILQNNIYRE